MSWRAVALFLLVSFFLMACGNPLTVFQMNGEWNVEEQPIEYAIQNGRVEIYEVTRHNERVKSRKRLKVGRLDGTKITFEDETHTIVKRESNTMTLETPLKTYVLTRN